jgi:hypothetical protein
MTIKPDQEKKLEYFKYATHKDLWKIKWNQIVYINQIFQIFI